MKNIFKKLLAMGIAPDDGVSMCLSAGICGFRKTM